MRTFLKSWLLVPVLLSACFADPPAESIPTPSQDAAEETFENLIDTYNRTGSNWVNSGCWTEAKAAFLQGWQSNGTWLNGGWRGTGLVGGTTWGTGGYAAPTVRYVRATGSDSNSGTSKTSAWRTLNKAVTTAPANSVIVLGAGVYQHTACVSVAKTTGPGGNSLGYVIYGDRDGYWTGDAGNVVVRGVKGVNDWSLRFNEGAGYILSGLTFEEDPTANTTDWLTRKLDWNAYLAAGYQDMLGLLFDRSSQVLLHNCSFTKFRHAVHLSCTADVEVRNCNFSNSRYMHFYPYFASKTTLFKCTFSDSDPKPVFQSLFQLYSYQSRTDVVNCSFDFNNSFKTQNDQTASADRITEYAVYSYANGYNGADSMQNLGMSRVWNSTFSNCNYIGNYGGWLRYFRSINNTFTNVRYGSHGHAENALTSDSTYSIPAGSPWKNQWSWGAYQHTFSAPVRTQYQTDYAAYKKTTGVTPKADFKNLTFSNYYVNLYIGSPESTITNVTVNGATTALYNDPNIEYSHGIYYNTPGSGTLTLNAASNIALSNCWWGIHANYGKLVLDGLTISGQHHGVYVYDSDLTVTNCSIVENKGHGLNAAWMNSVSLSNSHFDRNSRTYSGHWGAFTYGKKVARTEANGNPNWDEFTERYLYGTYSGSLSIANCTFSDNGSWGPNNNPGNGGIYGHGLGTYYFATTSLSANTANGNSYIGVQFCDGNYTLRNNAEITATGNMYGIASWGYSSREKVSPEFFTGNFDIAGYDVSGNWYGIYASSTNGTIANCRATNNTEIGVYTANFVGNLTDVTADGNGTGIHLASARNSTLTRVKGINSTKGWGLNLYSYRQYYGTNTNYTIVLRECNFDDNNYGGCAIGAYRHYQDASGTWVTERATDAVVDMKDITCHRNKHYGLHGYYCWVKPGTNLNIAANDNGTPQSDASGNPMYISGTIRQRNWAVGIYPYQIGRTLSISSAQGITASGNSAHGWINYYDPIVIDNMTFAANGQYGYNPAIGKGEFYGSGCSFYCAWNPSIQITNTTCNGGGIQVNHFDALTVNNITTSNCYKGLGVNWGYTDGNGKTWKPTAFELKNCTFNNGWYGYYQYGYDDNVVVPTTISNVTANGNKVYGIVAHRTPLYVRNLTATGNGYAGFYAWRSNVDMADTNISGNTTFLWEDGTRWGYYGTVIYDWEQPRTFVVKNCSFNDNEGYGLYAGADETGSNITVENCTLNNNRYHGYLGNVVSNTLKTVTASNCGRVDVGYWGIVISTGSATMTDCTANNNVGGGMYVHGRYGSETITREDGTTYMNYFANNNDTANYVNCVANNNGHSGMYALYCTGSFGNCQANGNRYYGLFTGYDDDAQTALSQINGCTANDNGSIGAYGYDIRLNVTNTTLLRNGHGLYHSSPSTEPDQGVFTNVTMSNGTGWGLLTYYQDTTVTNCRAENNAGGGALLHYGKKDVVTDSSFNGNQNIGLYAYLSKDAFVERCTMNGNRSYGAYFWQNDKAFARNCIIANNMYGVLMDDNLHGSQMWNCTITGSTGYYGFRAHRGNVTLMNSIVANNTSYGIYDSALGSFTHDNNLVYGHTAGTNYYRPGNTESQLVSANEVRKPPRFVDAVAGDYRLAKGSPAINSGVNAPGTVDTDMLGNARPMYGRTEMGAYEYLDKSGSVRIVDWKEER